MPVLGTGYAFMGDALYNAKMCRLFVDNNIKFIEHIEG